jgi:hypothetical protein
MTIQTQMKVSLGSLANQCLAEADGNTALAVNLMAQAFARPDITATLIDDAVKQALSQAISDAHCASRAAIIRQVMNPDGRAAVKAFANGMARTLLDFPLLDGTPLGRATRAQVEAALHTYRTQADEMNHRANWLQLILARVPVSGTVADVVSADQVKALWEQAL